MSNSIDDRAGYPEDDSGTEYSNKKQVKAIDLTHKLAEGLINQPKNTIEEMVNMYKHSEEVTYEDIASKYLPAKTNEFPNVAINAVSIAFNKIMDKEQLKEITGKKREVFLRNRFGGDFDTEAFKEQCRKGGKGKRDRGQHSGNYNTRGIIQDYGRTPWSEEENKKLLKNYYDSRFIRDKGNHKGKVDLGLIAGSINDKFHKGKVIRTKSSVQSRIMKHLNNYYSHEIKKHRKNISWNEDERKAFVKSYFSERFQYKSGNYKGKPNLNLIKNSINDKFHRGYEIRTKPSIENRVKKYIPKDYRS